MDVSVNCGYFLIFSDGVWDFEKWYVFFYLVLGRSLLVESLKKELDIDRFFLVRRIVGEYSVI